MCYAQTRPSPSSNSQLTLCGPGPIADPAIRSRAKSLALLHSDGTLAPMPTAPELAAFDRGIRPVLKILLPEKAEAVVRFRPDPALRERIDELAEKATEGELTVAE